MPSPIGRAIDRFFGDEPSVADDRKISELKRHHREMEDLKRREVEALEKIAKQFPTAQT